MFAKAKHDCLWSALRSRPEAQMRRDCALSSTANRLLQSWHTARMHRKFANAVMVLKQGKKRDELTNLRKPANDLNF
jgi:hypothetical protein